MNSGVSFLRSGFLDLSLELNQIKVVLLPVLLPLRVPLSQKPINGRNGYHWHDGEGLQGKCVRKKKKSFCVCDNVGT